MNAGDSREETATRLTGEARRLLELVLAKMGMPAPIDSLHRDGRLVLNILSREDDRFLIGRQGIALEALRRLLARMAHRLPADEGFALTLDVNDYGKRRLLQILEQARRAAERVREICAPVLICPYCAADRSVIHAFMAEHPAVITESRGDGQRKFILFKPRFVVECPGAEN